MRYYLHIPFCSRHCTYCRFALDPLPSEAKVAAYLGNLLREIEHSSNRAPFLTEWVKSVYFWGGTPSLLDSRHIEALLVACGRAWFVSDCEITIECNPEDITPERVRQYAQMGITRISLGVQTLSDRALQEIHRAPASWTEHAMEALAGFPNVNLDFMLGLPHVREGETLESIRALHSRYPGITHTSVYLLEYEHTYPESWQHTALSREKQMQEYAQIREFLLSERGFEHYEISNFALPWFQSRHNQAYWTHEAVQGFGLSAAGYLKDMVHAPYGVRRTNSANFVQYFRGIHEDEILSEAQFRLEEGIFGLRTFSLRPELAQAEALARLLDRNLLAWKGERIMPTLAWIFELDDIMGELF